MEAKARAEELDRLEAQRLVEEEKEQKRAAEELQEHERLRLEGEAQRRMAEHKIVEAKEGQMMRGRGIRERNIHLWNTAERPSHLQVANRGGGLARVVGIFVQGGRR